MRSSAAFGWCLVVPVALTACGGEKPEAEAAPPPAPPMGQAMADAMRSGYVDAYMRKDSTTVAGYYADDAVMYDPKGGVVTGKPAIVSALSSMMKAGMDSLGVASTAFTASGDEAVDEGTYVMRTLDPQTKEATREQGSYRITFRRQADGTFKIAKDSVFNATELK